VENTAPVSGEVVPTDGEVAGARNGGRHRYSEDYAGLAERRGSRSLCDASQVLWGRAGKSAASLSCARDFLVVRARQGSMQQWI
jgi:hypothetical protein